MAGLSTLFRVRIVAATSATFESRPYCTAITSYPSACSGGITLLKHEPSAQIPWANTMLGLVGGNMASSSAVVATAPVGGAGQTPAWPNGSRRSFTRSGEAQHPRRQQLRWGTA